MRIIMLACFLLFGFVAYSQTTVQGKVVDENNEPIPGANVILVGKAEGTTTDFDGNYEFKTSENPPFQLRISILGFSDAIVNVTSNNQTINVTLNEASTLLDEIVISASRTPERIFESPVTVERMDIKAIQSSTSPTFYDALENLKGVDINTNSLTFKSVNTRGFATFANTRFMQLVDGMDNSSPALNFPLGNLLGMSELDVNTVELLPGASSALYGANAYNGIMFMTSKSPFNHQGISFYAKTGLTSSSNAGDNDFFDVGIRAAHAFSDHFAAKASVSFLKGTEWFSTDYTDYNNPGLTRDDPAYDGLNIYGDEASTTLNFDELAAASLPIPVATDFGEATVSRTGYEERDLMDYDAESLKADFALHFKPWADDFEIVWNSKIGRGNTIYQGANRYAIKDFFMQQHKLEIRNNNFFVRGYTTAEKAGNSYDTRFAALNVNRRWKRDAPNPDNPSEPSWFGDYAAGFIGFLANQGIFAPTDEQKVAAHAFARQQADTGRFLPGTPEFNNALAAVTADPNLETGARFQDNSKIYHIDANYNFTHLTGDFADIMVGGSWRQYELNSGGTIYTDSDGPINYNEYGAYVQLQKKMLEEQLKFTGSIRYDKSEFFDGFVSPRLSLVYAIDENKRHNIRGSFQTGFRNPDTQSLFIGLNAGRAILVGSAPDNLDRYTTPELLLSTNGQALTGQQTVQLSGGEAYTNAFSRESVEAGVPQAFESSLVQPEQVTAYEVGYRGAVGKVNIDFSAYYNQYDDFISNRTVLVPLYGEAGDNALSLLALQNEDFQAFQTYTNSVADISSYGGGLGITTQIFGNYDFGINYTYAKLDFDRSSDPGFEPSFNTPEHKVKASFGNQELFKNFGFNINWRWNDWYLWEATFADGFIPSRHVVDAQVNFSVPSIKSIFKLGGANILGEEYVSAPGAGLIGSQFFVSWVINQ
ncbi:TonB-dependent receptor [Allomuricauda sp. SCSIO 65647]|uniref:TonB-dependent receptor n=1 Tax=Allomuricauda sp. SCSIO 65647 TaxID=2908843 RepID=UPI001F351554|nr:TonB-dependent receptor [Muricauda sp. SCSIO 65647]UJH66108.1 TonB-dependent receptor [Muricauda sp. SCSIO 65647]